MAKGKDKKKKLKKRTTTGYAVRRSGIDKTRQTAQSAEAPKAAAAAGGVAGSGEGDGV